MKKSHAVCAAPVMMISPLVRAEDGASTTLRFVHATVEQSEQSVLMGIDDSRDPRMLTSAASTMRQLKELFPDRSFPGFVIPLMRIVKNEGLDPTSRVTAAIALHRLQSAMGDFAIKRVGQFTSSDRVRHICTWLTYYRELGQQAPEISETPVPVFFAVEPLNE